MDSPDTFSLEGLDVSVAETPDALTYTFTPRNAGWQARFPVILVLLFLGLPLGLFAIIGYALDMTRGNRPEWELTLTGLFVVQMIGWAVVGLSLISGILRRWLVQSRGLVLQFTGTEVVHGDETVCSLANLRGLRLFVYPLVIKYLADSPLPRDTPPSKHLPPLPPEFAPIPPGERPPEKVEASLSLVMDVEGYTHGLFGGFDPAMLRTLAEHIQRRVAAFRENQGLMNSLDPLAVVETTEKEVNDLMNTRPLTGRSSRAIAVGNFVQFVLTYSTISTVWCVSMFAGLYASGRLIRAAGLNPLFLTGHVLLGFLHILFLFGAWGAFGPAEPPTTEPDLK